MLTVTCAVGSISVNSLLAWLASSDEPMSNIDKLTYAGILEAIAGLQDNLRVKLCGSIKIQRASY